MENLEVKMKKLFENGNKIIRKINYMNMTHLV